MTVIKNISNLGFLCDDDTVAHLVLLPEVPETTRSLYLSYIFQKYDKNKKFFIYLPSFINMIQQKVFIYLPSREYVFSN